MSLLEEKIPNKSLNGAEVLEIAVREFRAMLERDCMFLKTIAYRRVAMTLGATFHFGRPMAEHVVKSRVRAGGVVEGEAPLDPPEDEAVLVSLERDVALDNPNLARVHHDLPIRVQERSLPKTPTPSNLPGEPPMPADPFPEIVTKEIHYDKTQYPEGPAPVDRDVSAEKSTAMGLKPRGRVNKP